MNSIIQTTISISKNDTAVLALEITLDHDVVDLSTATCRLMVKNAVADADADAVINITNDMSTVATAAADIVNGLIYFKFAPTDTVNMQSKKYYYDITITDSNSDKYTVQRGDFYLITNIHNP
jgi:hypothetical protein